MRHIQGQTTADDKRIVTFPSVYDHTYQPAAFVLKTFKSATYVLTFLNSHPWHDLG
jgi:hypothetical protein